jgi:hypothetical protein
MRVHAMIGAWLVVGAGAFSNPSAWLLQGLRRHRGRGGAAATCSAVDLADDRAVYRELHRVGGGMFYKGVRGRSSGRGGLFPASDEKALDAFGDVLRVLHAQASWLQVPNLAREGLLSHTLHTHTHARARAHTHMMCVCVCVCVCVRARAHMYTTCVCTHFVCWCVSVYVNIYTHTDAGVSLISIIL